MRANLHRALLLLLPLSLCLLTVACGIDPDDLGGTLIESDVERAPAAASDEMLDAYALGQTEFAIRFLRAGFDDNESAVFSPYNIAEALTIAATFNAFDEHEVEALRSAVGIEDVQDTYKASNAFRHLLDERVKRADPDQLAYANLNDIWVEEAGMAESFDLETLQRYFGVGVRQTPLGSDTEEGADTINQYVDYYTQGLIPELIRPSQLIDVFAVVTTALYLKASWTGTFSEGSNRAFQIDQDSSRDIPYMSGSTSVTTTMDLYGEESTSDEDLLMVSIPLRGRIAFDIIAPELGTLPAYLQEFDAQAYRDLLEEVESYEALVDMPVFRIESAPPAKDVMVGEFGVPDSLFLPGKIGDIIHQSVIDVNETGIEAAAATAVTFFDNGDPGPEVTITVDRPFLYFLRDEETNVILFAGTFYGD